MRLVREYINEEFIEKSDPIHDMGIGSIFNAVEIMFHNTEPGAHGIPPGRSYATLLLKYYDDKKLIRYYNEYPGWLITVKGEDDKVYSLNNLIKKGYKYIKFKDFKFDITNK